METLTAKKQIFVYGGGTLQHIRCHLALTAPAYGQTALRLASLLADGIPSMGVQTVLTRQADPTSHLVTNDDVRCHVENTISDPWTKVIIMNTAFVDFEAAVSEIDVGGEGYRVVDPCFDNPSVTAKYGPRLSTSDGLHSLLLRPARKVLPMIRKKRKDIFLVGFKTTNGASVDEQYVAGLRLLKQSSANVIVANDVRTRYGMLIVPEEARYCVTQNRDELLQALVNLIAVRTQLTFTRSTVVGGRLIPWSSELVPESLRRVVDHCISAGAYKVGPTGATVGHFAVKVNDGTERTFLSSIRKSNFNDLEKLGLVRIVTDGPDSVIAYGARPSVGGQSQRIVFSEHTDYDCIVHFHCPKLSQSAVPVASQWEYECGSHECGANTSRNLQEFTLPSGPILCVYLDQHGPNIVFNRNIDPADVIKFIEDNFDLSQKTGGPVSWNQSLHTDDTVESLNKLL